MRWAALHNRRTAFALRWAAIVRYEHIHVGAGNLAISDIRLFGNGVLAYFS